MSGSVTLPGSKSITNRALLLAALVEGPVALSGVLFSRDTRLMLAALRALGFAVTDNEATATATITGLGGRIPVAEATLDVGNAGTVARFLTAFLCLHPSGSYRLDGDAAMRRRPMTGLLDALAALGVKFTFHGEPGCFPFTMATHGLPGGEVELDASASSQLLSALLLVGPAGRAPLTVRLSGATVSEPFIGLTRALLKQFGQDLPPVAADGAHVLPTGQPYTCAGGSYVIEPDATAASYFLVLPRVTGGALFLPGLPEHPLQGDAAFADLLPDLGLAVERNAGGWSVRVAGEPTPGPRKYDFNAISDTFLTLAALAPLLPGETWIHGIAHTRHQETDRIEAMAEGLRRLGQAVEQTPDGDGLIIRPNLGALARLGAAARAGEAIPHLATFEDHRVAMSFGVLGSRDLSGHGEPWLALHDPACCRKTFPHFFSQLDELRAAARPAPPAVPTFPFTVIAIDGGAASGKSSTARAVADRLHLLHVDTGAHYRAITHTALAAGVEPQDDEAVAAFLARTKLDTEVSGNRALVRIDGYLPHETELRAERVNQHVSPFAAHPAVRRFLFEYQRGEAAVARQRGFAGMIMEGRDIGSVIFPDADFKFYLAADTQVRAARRAAEGQNDAIAARDAMDSGRRTAPLTCPADAIALDTGHLSLSEVVELVTALIRRDRPPLPPGEPIRVSPLTPSPLSSSHG